MRIKKQFTLFTLAALLLLFTAPFGVSADTDIRPDSRFFWDKDHEWDPKNGKDVYRFASLDGDVYSAGWRKDSSDLNLYKRDGDDFSYKSKIVSSSDDWHEISFDPILFYHQGKARILYYYKQYKGYFTPDGYSYYYDGRRSVLASSENQDEHGSWTIDSRVNGQEHNFKIYRAACSIGGYLYLIYDSYVDNDEIHHHRNDIRVDKAIITVDGKLVVKETFKLEDVMPHRAFHPYAATWFHHADGNPRLLISYSAENTDDKENKGGGVMAFSPATNHWQYVYTSDYAFSVRAIHGTMQGKQSSPTGSRYDRDRIQVIINHFTDGHWEGFGHFVGDRGHFEYRTYDASDNDYDFIEAGEIKLGAKDRYPDEWNRMNLDIADELIPFESDHYGYTYHQKIWMFYTDKDGYVRGGKFNSDIWHHIENSKVASTDLGDTDTYGEEIKGTWKLFGIIEGPPPQAVCWEQWNRPRSEGGAGYNNLQDPTALGFNEDRNQTITTTVTTAGSWYASVEVDDEFAEIETKFTQKLEREEEFSTEISQSVELDFSLNEESQQLGVKLYLVPDITRSTYATFPWWADSYTDTENNSQPLNYRFVTTGTSIQYEFIPLSDPFFLGVPIDPYDPHLTAWGVNEPTRERLVRAATGKRTDATGSDYETTYADKITTTWAHPYNGNARSFSGTTVHNVTTTVENEFEISELISIPEAFDIGVGASLSWSDSSSLTTSFEQGLSLTLHNLITQDLGPLNFGLTITAYWFHGEDVVRDLWYLDLLTDQDQGQSPWYIGYTVGGVKMTDPYGNAPEDVCGE